MGEAHWEDRLAGRAFALIRTRVGSFGFGQHLVLVSTVNSLPIEWFDERRGV